jgi:uncharacterized membrane protein YciS (DUF1049 family)
MDFEAVLCRNPFTSQCSTRVYKSFIAGAVIAALIFGAVFFVFGVRLVHAQQLETSSQVSNEDIQPPESQATNTLANQPAVALSGDLFTDVMIDETVTLQDLGLQPSRVLPDSPWHGFKRFGWGMQELFTFDPVRKTQVRLDHAKFWIEP